MSSRCPLSCIVSSSYLPQLILEIMSTKVDTRHLCTMLSLAVVCNVAEKPLRHTALVLPKVSTLQKVSSKVSTKVSCRSPAGVQIWDNSKCPRKKCPVDTFGTLFGFWRNPNPTPNDPCQCHWHVHPNPNPNPTHGRQHLCPTLKFSETNC